MTGTCLVCGGLNASFFAEKNGYKLYRCGGCRLIFVHPKPEDTASFYSDGYFQGKSQSFGYVDYERDKEPMRETFIEFLRRMERHRPSKGRLLDVGAANGFFMRLAEKEGWAAEGVEIAADAAQEARSRGSSVRTGTLRSETWPGQSFDAVTMWDVLEHVTDPDAEIATAARLLKPGGILALNTPDAGSLTARLLGRQWHLLVPPEHLFYFNLSNLKFLLKKHGLDTRESSSIGKKYSLQYIARMLAYWQKLSFWQKLEKILQNRAWGQWGVPINLRDNVFLIAVKI